MLFLIHPCICRMAEGPLSSPRKLSVRCSSTSWPKSVAQALALHLHVYGIKANTNFGSVLEKYPGNLATAPTSEQNVEDYGTLHRTAIDLHASGINNVLVNLHLIRKFSERVCGTDDPHAILEICEPIWDIIISNIGDEVNFQDLCRFAMQVHTNHFRKKGRSNFILAILLQVHQNLGEDIDFEQILKHMTDQIEEIMDVSESKVAKNMKQVEILRENQSPFTMLFPDDVRVSMIEQTPAGQPVRFSCVKTDL